jgi:PAS domain S-box-containing protein
MSATGVLQAMTEALCTSAELFDALPSPAALIDAEGLILDTNSALMRYAQEMGHEVRESDTIGLPLIQLPLNFHDRSQLQAVADQVLKGQETRSHEAPCRDAAGRPHFIDLQGSPLRDASGTVVGGLIVLANVTDRVMTRTRASVLGHLRSEIWHMTSSGQMQRLLLALTAGLQRLGVPFADCAVTLIDARSEPPAVRHCRMAREGQRYSEIGEAATQDLKVRTWREGRTQLRRKPQSGEPCGILGRLRINHEPTVGAVDVPFKHGILAISGQLPGIFSPQEVGLLEEMAGLLSVGLTHWRDMEELEREVTVRRRAEAERKRSGLRHRRLVEYLPLGIADITMHGRLLYANRHARRMLGYRDDDTVPASLLELLVDPNEGEEFIAALQRDGLHPYECRVRRRDHRTIWVRGTARVVCRDDGQISHMQVFAEDVTSQKRQELERQAQERVREAVWALHGEEDVASLVVVIRLCLTALDIDFCGIGINIAEVSLGSSSVRCIEMVDGHRRQRQSVIDSQHQLIIDAWQQHKVMYRRDLGQEDPYGEALALRKGYSKTIRSVVDIPFSHGTLAVNSTQPHAFSEADIELMQQLASALSDGFRRLEDLEQLRQRARESESLAAAIAVVAQATDLDSIFQTVVKEGARLMGCDRGVLFLYEKDQDALVPQAQVGHDWSRYQHLRLRPGEGTSGRVYQLGEPIVTAQGPDVADARIGDDFKELPYQESDGSPTGVGISVPLRLHDEVIGALSVGTRESHLGDWDVRLLERLGQQAVLAIDRAHQLDELADRTRELEQQMEELTDLEVQLRHAQKMEAVGQLTAGIAHNFNNLLQGIVGNLGLGLLDCPHDMRPLLQDAQEACNRAAELVQQMMIFARQGTRPQHQEVNIQALVDNVLEICRRTFDRRIGLISQPADEDIIVRGDPGQLEQVMLNLLINARDALNTQPEMQPYIRLSTSITKRPKALPGATSYAGQEYLSLEVEDNGPGMDAATRARVFEPFFTTKEVGSGTGLGLSTVYGIVQQHDGWIGCESVPGAWSRFTVYLPLSLETASAPAAAPAATPAGSGQTILVVDDEEIVRQTSMLMLEHFGFNVMMAADGQEALAALELRRNSIDLVLLDLSMPGLSGQEVLNSLKQRFPDLPVVLFTGYATTADQFPGASGVAQKPFKAGDLTQLILSVLNNS